MSNNLGSLQDPLSFFMENRIALFINLMEEKNNELKRVIQITRANSLKQQNTGLVPILGNIKTTKAFHKFCGELNKIEAEVRSLI